METNLKQVREGRTYAVMCNRWIAVVLQSVFTAAIAVGTYWAHGRIRSEIIVAIVCWL